jgi:hypothetical protein
VKKSWRQTNQHLGLSIIPGKTNGFWGTVPEYSVLQVWYKCIYRISLVLYKFMAEDICHISTHQKISAISQLKTQM